MIRLHLAIVSLILLVGARRLEDTAFVFAEHDEHGFLLLRSYKQGKGYHEQIPGGHLDTVGVDNNVKEDARVAAARELFEETGINTKDNLDRLEALPDIKIGKRTYFYLHLEDSDSNGDWPVKDITTGSPVGFKINMDGGEHTDAFFEKDARKVPNHILKHSGGNNSIAFQNFLDARDNLNNQNNLNIDQTNLNNQSNLNIDQTNLNNQNNLNIDQTNLNNQNNLSNPNNLNNQSNLNNQNNLSTDQTNLNNDQTDDSRIISIDNKENRSGSNVRLILAITIPLAVLIVLATIIGVVLYKRKQKSQLA